MLFCVIDSQEHRVEPKIRIYSDKFSCHHGHFYSAHFEFLSRAVHDTRSKTDFAETKCVGGAAQMCILNCSNSVQE
jgi:hypothetical protein